MLAAAGCLLAVAVLTLAGWGLLQVRAELHSQRRGKPCRTNSARQSPRCYLQVNTIGGACIRGKPQHRTDQGEKKFLASSCYLGVFVADHGSITQVLCRWRTSISHLKLFLCEYKPSELVASLGSWYLARQGDDNPGLFGLGKNGSRKDFISCKGNGIRKTKTLESGGSGS